VWHVRVIHGSLHTIEFKSCMLSSILSCDSGKYPSQKSRDGGKEGGKEGGRERESGKGKWIKRNHLPGAPRPSNPVRMRVLIPRRIKVDDVPDCWHVEASRCHISRYENLALSLRSMIEFQKCQDFVILDLRLRGLFEEYSRFANRRSHKRKAFPGNVANKWHLIYHCFPWIEARPI